jgi:hypothetical protein
MRADIAAGVASGRYVQLRNLDEDNVELELADARDQQVRPVLATDLKRLKALAADGDEVKWVVRTDGALLFGPTTITHAAVAGGKPVVAAGQAYLFETPVRRLAVLRLTNKLGHYQPKKETLALPAKVFDAHGLARQSHTCRNRRLNRH